MDVCVDVCLSEESFIPDIKTPDMYKSGYENEMTNCIYNNNGPI